MAPTEEPIETQPATSHLRQISEPHALALADEQQGQDEAVPPVRRLASDYLVEHVRHADNPTIVIAAKTLGQVCQQELSTTCGRELRLLQMVMHIAKSEFKPLWTSPLVQEGLRTTQICLATNSDDLSPPCMDAMLVAFMRGKDTPPTEMPNAVWQPPGAHLAADGKEAKRRAGHKMRHHKHDDNDSSDDPELPSQGLEIYVINNNNGAGLAGNGYAVGPWGTRDRRHHHRQGTHPLVWMVVVPFFCVGVFVCVKRAVAYLKQRRDGTPLFATQSRDYEPLKMPDSPPQ